MAVQPLTVDGWGWGANAIFADASGTEDIKTAPTDGTSYYVEYVSLNTDSAITITIGAGETAGAVTTALVGPVEFTTSGGQYAVTFTRPVKVGANTALTVDASGAGDISVVAYGYQK